MRDLKPKIFFNTFYTYTFYYNIIIHLSWKFFEDNPIFKTEKRYNKYRLKKLYFPLFYAKYNYIYHTLTQSNICITAQIQTKTPILHPPQKK